MSSHTFIEIPELIENDIEAMTVFITNKLTPDGLSSLVYRMFLRYSEYMITMIHQRKPYIKNKEDFILRWANRLYKSIATDWTEVCTTVGLPTTTRDVIQVATFIEFMLPTDDLLDKWHDVINSYMVPYSTLMITPKSRIITLVFY